MATNRAVMPPDHRLIEKVIRLSWFTIVYNFVEGLVSIGFGVNDESISLLGFGMDSFIEVASATFVLWRFRVESKSALSVEHIDRERKATVGIGLLFLALAAATIVASIVQLLQRTHPETTLPGLAISSISLSFMFFLWRSKLSLGRALNSSTVLKDASCSLACIKLSGVLFVGSLLYLLVPSLWWTDALAAVVLAWLIGREGLETVRAARSKDFTGGCGCAHCE